jgi:hypothetical protein
MDKLLDFIKARLETAPMWVDYPYSWATEQAREQGLTDDELIRLLNHPEYEDFHSESLIRALCDTQTTHVKRIRKIS